jgi:hypothetical protein
MNKALRVALAIAAAAVGPTSAGAQDGVIVYRLGRDTVAIEQYSRSSSRLTGEMVSRGGGAVIRTQYDIALSGGRPTAATVKRLRPDGTPLPNSPSEYRLTFRADSAVRETVWPDSTQRRAWAVANAFPLFPVFVHAPMELINAMGRGRRDSIPGIGITGNNLGFVGLETLGGDTVRMRGGFYAWLMRFDRDNRLLSVDGLLTTNKSLGTRERGRVDLAALAAAMRPAGTLSPRQTAYAAFSQGPITINYGSPAVRGRTVWGGTLVPFDTIWRTGANEATHLATSKTMQIGDMTLTPGLYTLWTQHTRTGTYLIVNRQVGQWGTNYNAANDVGRVQMQLADAPAHVEDFTITIRPLGQGRGAIDIAWGDKVATANFTAR